MEIYLPPIPNRFINGLPEDINFIESYCFDYNRYIDYGKTGYAIIYIFYTKATNKAEIQAVVVQFKKTKERFFEIFHSNSISHVHIGTLTSSVKSMENSYYFLKVFKKLLKLSELGLWLTQARNKNG